MSNPLDLTDLKVSDTFPRLVQTDGNGGYYDGLGNLLDFPPTSGYLDIWEWNSASTSGKIISDNGYLGSGETVLQISKTADSGTGYDSYISSINIGSVILLSTPGGVYSYTVVSHPTGVGSYFNISVSPLQISTPNYSPDINSRIYTSFIPKGDSGNAKYHTTYINTATHSATFVYDYYGVTYTGGICTVTLPSGTISTDEGRLITIADEVGNISYANRGILVQGTGGQLINGESSVLMKIDRMSLTFMFRNNYWKTI